LARVVLALRLHLLRLARVVFVLRFDLVGLRLLIGYALTIRL
jgi:hypothetical protein